MDTVIVLQLTLCVVVAVVTMHLIGPSLVVAAEEWFYGRPVATKSRANRLWLERNKTDPAQSVTFTELAYFAVEFLLRGRVWFYLCGTALLLIASGVVIGSVFSTASQLTKQLDVAQTGLSPSQLALITQLGSALLACCATRVATITYQPSLMRAVVVAGLGLVVSVLIAALVIPVPLRHLIQTTLAQSGLSPQDLLLCILGSASICGFVTESLLWFAPRYWGRSESDKASRAGYACIICGAKGEVHGGSLRSACHPDAHVRGKAKRNFRRESGGW